MQFNPGETINLLIDACAKAAKPLRTEHIVYHQTKQNGRDLLPGGHEQHRTIVVFDGCSNQYNSTPVQCIIERSETGVTCCRVATNSIVRSWCSTRHEPNTLVDDGNSTN
eukprot:TRINITY_DN2993_c0_g1_i1.p1 TRINITY_DN2993_c0_g1~~TRINITY_DN2993_c0_g1_i1.p1  ORF type:complete len:110 (-),score=8.67 TRINITY_DN2993_c0_g1_i1:295-624(-)